MAYYSGKYNIYGYNVEVSVIRNGIEIACSYQVPGATLDIDVMRHMVRTQNGNPKTCADELDITDTDPHVKRHGILWDLFGEKGYQEAINGLQGLFCHP